MAATHSLLRMSFHPAFFSIVILLSICKSLVANAETIHGRIIDSQDVPVAHAHLTLLNAGGTAIAHATSDAQGGFTLQNIDPGVYQISAGAPYSSRLLLMSLLVGAGKLKEISVQFTRSSQRRSRSR